MTNAILARTPSSSSVDSKIVNIESSLQQLLENIDEVFWIVSCPDRRAIYISPAVERVWGRKREDVMQSADAWADSVHPEDKPRMLEVFATLQPGSHTYRIVRPDGT